MNQNEFTRLFQSALELAATRTEQRLNQRVSRHFTIRLAFPNEPSLMLAVERAAEELYLTPDKFYLVIDLSVVEVKRQETVVLVRPAPGAPGPFRETWNEPLGSGPFRQLELPTIHVAEPSVSIPMEQFFKFNLAVQPS